MRTILPLTQGPEERDARRRQPREQADDSPLAQARVLVAEPMAVIALDLEHTLWELDCVVLGPVSSVADALLLQRERPDAALLELDLQDGHAAPLAEKLASLGVPFALATFHQGSEADDPALRAAVRVMKPYSRHELHRALIRLLQAGPESCKPVPSARSIDHEHPRQGCDHVE